VSPSPRDAQLVARRILLATPEPAEPETDSAPEDAPKIWDEARVARHLERAAAQALQVARRAAWLCLLADSSVAYREPGATTQRLLTLREASLTATGELTPGAALPFPEHPDRRRTRLAFDAARYDSLRILTTELKRVLRDGGDVQVRLSRTRLLEGTRLASVLRLV
jgi:hypothetical protein